jgi:3-hydroxybutyryl-CoA dehydrogenase
MKPVEADDYTVAVVGAGAMGQGIVQVSAQGGMRTIIYDAKDGAAAAAKDTISKRILRLVEKGRLTEQEADAAIARMEPVSDLAGLKDADCVVEAIFEDIDVKQALFKDIEAVVSRDCIICSNTSSIPIAAIGRVCEHRDRLAGLHFFNPVPLMKLVEVIRAAETSDETVAALTEVGKRMTRVPVTVKDSPGFLVNLGGRSFTTEGLRIAHDQVASPSQIDAIMRDCCGFRMGPFELMDLTGIDVNYPVSQIIYNGYNQDPRLKTSPNHKAMFDAGTFGRKTGQGWYRYQDGKAIDVPSPDHTPDAAPATAVALVDDDERLQTLCDALSIQIVSDDGEVPLLAAPTGDDATHTALIEDVDPQRLVCVDVLFDTSKRVTLMMAPGADRTKADAVAAAIIASGRKATLINDSPGFVAQRMCAMIGNLGCFMAEIGLASPDDINTAMELGLNYPLGPLKLVEKMEPDATLAIMEALSDLTGDPRYRPTLWLRRRAELGLSIHETVPNPN